MNYRNFELLMESPLTALEWKSTDETPATEEEIGFRSMFETRRAKKKHMNGDATRVDLELLDRSGYDRVTGADYGRASAREISETIASLDELLPL